MTTNHMPPPLPRADLYALSRVLTGLDWQDVPVSPLLANLLHHIDVNKPVEVQMLRRWLGAMTLQQILAEDPTAPFPEREADIKLVPELPADAQVNRDRTRAASRAGRWLEDYVAWAGGAANETPLLFHQGMGLYLAAIAIGRRLCVDTPWQQQVFPNLYIMAVAVSTYFRKSAGLNLGAGVVRAALPHMLMPQPGSPENFLNMLGGVLPANFQDIPVPDRERLLRGNQFAAQRGILRDEISGLFKSMGRDFMSGMKELIMQLYDCPPYLDSNTNQRGIVVIRDAALSIFGAATPAELAASLTSNDWYNGNLARFALLTPEPDYAERPARVEREIPRDLVARLQRLHEALPLPPLPAALGDTPQAETWSLAASVWEPCQRYERALRHMTAPDSPLDDRLRAVYGRLHVQALKVALCLAALDWADGGAEGRPEVSVTHWYRAQQIAESWRASAHRLLHDLGESEESRLEVRVLRLLRAHPGGLTLRAIYKALRSTRRAAAETLAVLEQDGQVRRVGPIRDGRPGPHPDYYFLNR